VRWPDVLPLIADFWRIVCSRIEPRARAGRLKQWLNFLRRRFPEAETAYQAIKTVNDPVLVQAWLVQALRSEGLEQPAVHQPLLEEA
jgi:tRNA-dihydrouridine synthase C